MIHLRLSPRFTRLLLAASAAAGIFVGVGSYTFHYAGGASYLGTDPASCANCHIMQPQYDAWLKSSHHSVATCNDCHLPASGLAKWISKADNGFVHSSKFTLQNFHEPIRLRRVNEEILQDNCVRCHTLIENNALSGAAHQADLDCVHCHSDVGHGPRAGLGGPIDWSQP